MRPVGCPGQSILATLWAHFLELLASIYPGYTANSTFGGMLNVTLYALIDGAVGGLIFGWLYNWFATKCDAEAKQK